MTKPLLKNNGVMFIKKALAVVLVGVFLSFEFASGQILSLPKDLFTNTLSWAKEERLFSTGIEDKSFSFHPVDNNKLAPESRLHSEDFKYSLTVAAICKHIEHDGNLDDRSYLNDVLARLDAEKNSNITVLPYEIIIEIPNEGLAIRYFDPTKANVITPYSDVLKLQTEVIGPRLNRQIIRRLKPLSADFETIMSEGSEYLSDSYIQITQHVLKHGVGVLKARQHEEQIDRAWFVKDATSVGICGFNSLGMALYTNLGTCEFIGRQNSRSTLNIIGGFARITFNGVDYSNLTGFLKNGLRDAWARTGSLPGVIMLTTQVDGIYSFADEFIRLLSEAQSHSLYLDKEKLPVFIICSNGIEVMDFFNRLYRMVENSDLQHKDESYKLLKSLFVFGATYQTASQNYYPTQSYDFRSDKKGMIILGGEDGNSCNRAYDVLLARQYNVKIEKGFNAYVQKNLTFLSHGILPIVYLSKMSDPMNQELTLGDIIDPRNNPDKFVNAETAHAGIVQNSVELAAAYYRIIQKLGFNLSGSPENAYISINDRVKKLGIESHVPSAVRFFKFAVINNYPITDQLDMLNSLSLLARRFGLEEDEKLFQGLKESICNIYKKLQLWIDQEDEHIVKIDGQINFTKLEHIFNLAAREMNISARVTFVGSAEYLGKDADCRNVSDIDYCIYGIEFKTEGEKCNWLNRFYETINKRIAREGRIFASGGLSNFGTSHSAILEMPLACKKQFYLHMPPILSSGEEFQKCGYIDSMIIWRWFTDKARPERLDKEFCVRYPAKAVKRFLGLASRIAKTDTQHAIFAKAQNMFVENISCVQILSYVEKTGILGEFANYMQSAERSLNLSEDVRSIFSQTETGNAARQFLAKHASEVDLSKLKRSYPELLLKLPNMVPINIYTDKNKEIFKDILEENKPDTIIRVPVEVIESIGIDNIKDFLATFQEAPNGYVELYYMSGVVEASESVYQKYGLQKEPLPKDFKRNRENTVTLFPALKGEEISQSAIVSRLGSFDTTPENTILSPIGLQHDPAGLIRAAILGLKMMDIARQIKEKGIGITKDQAFKDKIQLEILEQLKNVCDADDLKNFNLTPDDIIALATGTINNIIAALQKLVKLLPITPINAEELRQIYERVKEVIAAA